MHKSPTTRKQFSLFALFIAVLAPLVPIGNSFAAGEQENKVGDAIKDLRPYSKEAVSHYNQALEAHQQGFLNHAISEYKAAIQADNRMEEAYDNLGVIYSAQHNYDEAIDCFQKALLVRPNSTVSLCGLGNAFYATGKIDQAIAKWRRVIEIDPNFKSAYHNLARALKETGHDEEAKKVLDSEPKDPAR
jgi:tetratricopeptide (TPR) repeat protein